MSDSKFLDGMVDVVKKQFGADRKLQCGAVAVLSECVVGTGDFDGKPLPAVLVKWEVPAAEQADGAKLKATTLLAENELRLNVIGDDKNTPLAVIIKSRIDQTMQSFDDIIRLKPISLKPPKSYRTRPFSPSQFNLTSPLDNTWQVELACADCFAKVAFKSPYGGAVTARIGKQIREAGWIRVHGQYDVCPDCAKEAELPKVEAPK